MALGNISDMFKWADEALRVSDYDDWVSAWRTGVPERCSSGHSSLFKESEDTYSLFLPLAGLGKEDVNVTVLDGVIKLTAKGKVAEQEIDISKAIPLPTKADPESLEAKMEKGLLSIVVQKRQKDKQKVITVS
jgi:HSP20 family molecular chaperone IbpA